MKSFDGKQQQQQWKWHFVISNRPSTIELRLALRHDRLIKAFTNAIMVSIGKKLFVRRSCQKSVWFKGKRSCIAPPRVISKSEINCLFLVIVGVVVIMSINIWNWIINYLSRDRQCLNYSDQTTGLNDRLRLWKTGSPKNAPTSSSSHNSLCQNDDRSFSIECSLMNFENSMEKRAYRLSSRPAIGQPREIIRLLFTLLVMKSNPLLGVLHPNLIPFAKGALTAIRSETSKLNGWMTWLDPALPIHHFERLILLLMVRACCLVFSCKTNDWPMNDTTNWCSWINLGGCGTGWVIDFAMAFCWFSEWQLAIRRNPSSGRMVVNWDFNLRESISNPFKSFSWVTRSSQPIDFYLIDTKLRGEDFPRTIRLLTSTIRSTLGQ